MPPISEPRTVDFGPGVGRRGCYLYNLPETESCFANLGVPSVSARFGTAPFFWNWAMWLTARLAPQGGVRLLLIPWSACTCRVFPVLLSAASTTSPLPARCGNGMQMCQLHHIILLSALAGQFGTPEVSPLQRPLSLP